MAPIALVLAALATSGCTQFLSIDEDALVVGAAVDTGTTPGSVEATLQWYHPSVAPSAGSGASGSTSATSTLVTLRGDGPDVSRALDKIQGQTEQELSFLVTTVLLVGDTLARQGVNGPLNFFWRNPDVSETAFVAVTRGPAANVLEAPTPGGTAFSLYRFLTISGASTTPCVPIPFWRFMALANTPYAAAWAPLFEEAPSGYRSAGTAVFRGDRLADELGLDDTKVLTWLLLSGGYQDLSLPPGQAGPGPVDLRVNSRRLHWTVADPYHAVLRLDLNTQIDLGRGVRLLDASPTTVARLQSVAAAEARSRVEAVIGRLQRDRTDILGVGERLRQADPAAVAGWPEKFAQMEITVDVRVRVVPSGREA